MTSALPRKASKPPSRRGLYLPYLALAIACVGWSIFWFVASSATDQALDDWLAQEKLVGRNWSCPAKSVGGYPFRIEIRCASPSFEGRVGGLRGSGAVGDLLAAANLYNPALIVGEIKPPFSFRSSDQSVLISLDWTSLRVSHRNRGGAFESGSLEIDGPSLRIQVANMPDIAGRAAKFEAYGRPAPDQDRPPAAVEAALRVTGAAVPNLDRVTGEDAPLDGLASMIVTQAAAFNGANFPVALERWREMGGQVQVTEGKLAKGNARMEASGAVELDASHRLQGRFQVQLSGLSPILQKFGIPLGSLAINDLIGGLLGGKPAPSRTDQGGGTPLQLPLTLANGRVAIGPLRLPIVLNPLY